MNELWKFLLLFAVGSIAGFVNVNAGGGSTITLPTMIFLGLDSTLANGTNRVAILIQNIFAVSSFRKQEVHQFRESLKLSYITLPGAVAGALISVRISDEWFQRILALVMIAVVVSMFIPRTQKIYTEEISTAERRWLIYVALFFIGFYGGFIQVGVGFLFMAALYHILKISLVHVNMHKVFIVLIYTIPSLAVFALSGKVNWIVGICLAAGNAAGAWFGAKASVKGGEKLIRGVLALAVVLMAVKLLFK
ncbi:MAG TPA: sulfite exporter TauE/SafE family protein [Candidatus Marinimicrobia bacterium]|nr:sulfite exporter TauE/SafE family protein [Candidatus Neomarinimicrobiota bacterium]